MNVGIFKTVDTSIKDGVVEIICREKIEEISLLNASGFAKKVELYMDGIQILKCSDCGRDKNGEPYYRYSITELVSGTYNLKII